MRLTFTTEDDRIINLDVDGEQSLDDIKAILEVDSDIPMAEQVLVNQNNIVTGATAAQAGLHDGDLVMLLRRKPTRAPPSGGSVGPSGATPPALRLNPNDGSAVDPQAFIEFLLADKMQLSMLDMQLPALAAAVKAKDAARLQTMLRESHAAKKEAMRKQELLLTGDPMDPEVQALIAEQIHQKAIDENLEQAMEYSPEAFAHVFMLYVNAEVNGHKFKAFVDSGAQMSIMTLACAERCNLSRLIDRRYQGIAKGVGQSTIVGRIHQAPLKVEGEFLPLAVSVLEQKGGPQFIIGLDMLKRYQCCIDLSKNELRFSSVNVALPFLAEHELPKDFENETDGPAQPVASSAPAAAAGAAAQARATASAEPGNDKVQRLMALGFSQQQAQAALDMCNGNEEMAASVLFGG